MDLIEKDLIQSIKDGEQNIIVLLFRLYYALLYTANQPLCCCQTETREGLSPWVEPPIYTKTRAQASIDKWRLGMQWYTHDKLQPPAQPSAILAYQIDQSLSKYIRLVPYGTTKLRIAYFPYSVNVIQ
jgi:hypothetical protein